MVEHDFDQNRAMFGRVSASGAQARTSTLHGRSRRGSRAALRRRASRIGLFPAVALALLAGLAVAFAAYTFLRRITPVDVTKTAAEIDVTRVALTVVAGVGGVVALVIAYRRQRDLEQSRFVERFGAAAAQLGAPDVAVRIAGVYAMAGVADESDGLRRQQCVDVLCGYLRLPYDAEHGASGRTKLVIKAPRIERGRVRGETEEHIEYRQNDREVRATIVRVIADHLRPEAEYSWSTSNFDFRTAYLENADFSQSIFSGVVRFEAATFSGDAAFGGATFRNYVAFRKATFSGFARFHRVTFGGGADFSGVVFAADAAFGGATFTGEAAFGGATFNGRAQFYKVVFGNYTAFGSATFTGTTEFEATTFTGTGDFSWATFNDVTRFEGTTFTKAKFERATFTGITEFEATTFSGDADFHQATFTGATRFKSAFSGAVWFQGASFSCISFAGTDFGSERVIFTRPRQWGPPPPEFDWAADGDRKPSNVEPADWPPTVVAAS
ncbi:pentapeptide repeat-containing protein [Nocardia sp. SC052]|uniref:pentapeptide repeat-containing protein n=1 Tax=Nocardia sichangensis TaxID=3385975 RepID=UPI00399FC560